MRAVFISYRRDDSEGHAGRLFEDLCERLGRSAVFMDVAGIGPGQDFRRAIEVQVAECGVLLALIGKGWLDSVDEAGRRRLDDPRDFVRLETAAALKRDIPVVPVLVHGARMPRAEQLPEDLRELAYRNAVELTHARWDSDVGVLIEALRPHVDASSEEQKPGRGPPAPEVGPTNASSRSLGLPLAGLGLLLAVLVGFAGYFWRSEAKTAAVDAGPAKTAALQEPLATTKTEALPPAPVAAREEPDREATRPEPTVPPKPEPCSARSGYPVGRWQIGEENQTPNKYVNFVTFTKSTSGTWLPSTGQGSFTASAAPRPGQEIVITFRPEEGAYRSTNKLVVSSDGCRMQGTYSDTEGHHGEAIYTWQG
jgi:hypothetical protein